MLLTVLLLTVIQLAFCAYTAVMVMGMRADLDEFRAMRRQANGSRAEFWEGGRAQDLTDSLQ
jgi:hypothetical protein